MVFAYYKPRFECSSSVLLLFLSVIIPGGSATVLYNTPSIEYTSARHKSILFISLRKRNPSLSISSSRPYPGSFPIEPATHKI